MAQREDHLKIARDNEFFRASLNPANGPARGWAATVAFYEALHLVEAFLATRAVHSPDHRTRDSSLSRFAETKRIYDEFSDLKMISINARYWGTYPDDSEIACVVEPALAAVKLEMKKAMGIP